MSDDKKTAVYIRRIAITNYKGIDHLDLAFPEPLMAHDPDVMVLGSANGVGKTSVLECCALLLLAVDLGAYQLELSWEDFNSLDIPDLIIRAGSDVTTIAGDIEVYGAREHVEFHMERDGTLRFRCPTRTGERKSRNQVVAILHSIWGVTPEPVAVSTFAAFNSYRKVQQGFLDLGMMVEKPGFRKRNPSIQSEQQANSFKVLMLRTMMGKADLFELDREAERDSDIATVKLNELFQRFAGGTVSRLRPSPDNAVDFRIEPDDGGTPYTFDGLSSGQKEIISTLFLVWFYTINHPRTVLIDEPELHLNAQWHRTFVNSLLSLAPQNQYILATHSEFVMGSVDKERRVLLSVEPSVVG